MSRVSRSLPPRTDEQQEIAAARAFVRALAAHAEHDATFAAALARILRESDITVRAAARTASDTRAAVPSRAQDDPGSLPDPFRLLHQGGEEHLRSVLRQQSVHTLHGIVRAHRLDPARISARWSTADRLVALIVEQVCARAARGRAFEHV